MHAQSPVCAQAGSTVNRGSRWYLDACKDLERTSILAWLDARLPGRPRVRPVVLREQLLSPASTSPTSPQGKVTHNSPILRTHNAHAPTATYHSMRRRGCTVLRLRTGAPTAHRHAQTVIRATARTNWHTRRPVIPCCECLAVLAPCTDCLRVLVGRLDLGMLPLQRRTTVGTEAEVLIPSPQGDRRGSEALGTLCTGKGGKHTHKIPNRARVRATPSRVGKVGPTPTPPSAHESSHTPPHDPTPLFSHTPCYPRARGTRQNMLPGHAGGRG